MPYVGANVKKDNLLVQVKLHGPDITHHFNKYSKVKDSVRTILGQNIEEPEIAEYIANITAKEFESDTDVVWVEVEVATADGDSFGFIKTLSGDEYQ